MWCVTAYTDLAACRSCAILVSTGNVVVVCEEVGIALIAEGQAQNGLGVLHCVPFAVCHLSCTQTILNTCLKTEN